MKALRVMTVDDSLITVRKFSQMLQDLGHEVVATARTGTEAVSLYKETLPDVVTMDITLPDIDGIEATRRILAEAPGALVVMITSHGQEQMVIDSIDAGAKGYLLKPIKPETLKETLESVFEKYGKKTND